MKQEQKKKNIKKDKRDKTKKITKTKLNKCVLAFHCLSSRQK